VKVDENLVLNSILNVPDGGLMIFDVDGDTHLGIKAVNPPYGPCLVTLSHPDYEGTPGLWAYRVASADLFAHLPNAVFRPTIQIDKIFFEKAIKPGYVVKSSDQLFLRIRTDRASFGYIDLANGHFYETLPSRTSFQIARWKIVIEHKLYEDILFEFPKISP